MRCPCRSPDPDRRCGDIVSPETARACLAQSGAAGLMVGIVAYVCYHILMMMVDKVILKLETDAIEFIDLLEEPSK